MANIEFEYKNKKYTLGFTPESIYRLEKKGADYSNLDKRVLTQHLQLFYDSFEAYHRDTPMETRKEILAALNVTSDEETEENAKGIMEALSSMFIEAINNITRPSGNIPWKMV